MNALRGKLAARIQGIAESKTTKVFELAQTMRQQGRDIIDLSVGEPDFTTPQPIIAATGAALADQATRYGPVAGLPALRRRLADQFNGYSVDNILISNGAKQALFSLFQAICDPGTRIIVPAPCWVSFSEQIKLAGGTPVLVACPNHQLDPERIEEAISPRTRAILINSPNNPTGAVYDRDVLTAVARIAEANDLFVISDEAYHVYSFDQPHVTMLEVSTRPQRVITVRSFSKHYNMTGFRIGYVAAHPSIIRALTKIQGHATGNVCTFAQHGALAALDMDQAIVGRCRDVLARRRDLAYGCASDLFPCVKPQGAFYLFPDVTPRLRPGESSADLALRLLDKAGVALVPGEAFYGAGHVRISFAVAEDKLHQAFERIRSIL